MNYNMDGRFVMSLYIENYHNDLKSKEPKELFMEKIKSALAKEGIDCDWIECQNYNVEIIKDHTNGLNTALYNSGYGIKAIEMPKCIDKGITAIGGEMMGEIELWRGKTHNEKEIVFLVIGGDIYLPCNPLNYFLIFDSDCCEATKTKSVNDVFKTYWMKDNNVYILRNDGTFFCIYNSRTKYNPTIGQRLANVRAAIDDDVYLIHSSAYELNLGSATEENLVYEADFSCGCDIEPTSIVATKRIL